MIHISPDAFASGDFPFDLLVREHLCAMGCADEKTVFCANHFSHNGGNVTYGVFAERAKEKGFLTSYDGMTVEF